MTTLVLPILVVVVGALLVALLGDTVKEFVFPTKADVVGSALVNGQPAAGAALILDQEPAGYVGEQGGFRIRDVDDGHHRLVVRTRAAKGQPIDFRVERGENEHALGKIELAPLFQLGYYLHQAPDASTATISYDVTLWIEGSNDALRRIASVTYTPPPPLTGPVTTRTSAQAFCHRWIGAVSFQEAGNGGFLAAGVKVELKGGSTFTTAAPYRSVPPESLCRAISTSHNGGTTTHTTNPSSPTAVPSVVGEPLAAATATIHDAHLAVHVVHATSNEPKETVVAQRPKAQTSVNRGSEIELTVSSGPVVPTSVVPLVAGQPFAPANSTLQEAGFSVKKVDVDSNSDAGVVVEQTPKAGTSAPKGSTVTVSVSRGPPTTEIPDVTGLDKEAATATIEQAGFDPKVSNQPVIDPAMDGTVIEQTPKGGEAAKPGTIVTLVVGQLKN